MKYTHPEHLFPYTVVCLWKTGLNVSKINETAFYKELGQRLKARRLELLSNQDQVAAHIGIERTSLAHIEAARQKPALHTLLLLCRELHTTVEAIVPNLDDFEIVPEAAPMLPELEDKIQIVGEKGTLTPALSAFLRAAQRRQDEIT